MSKKSTFIDSNHITLSPEFEQLLKSKYGFVKQEDNITSVKSTETLPIQSKTKVKTTITNNHPIESQYHQHMPVQAIPTEYIQKAKEYFHNPHSRYHMNDIRDYCYFTLSINTARRAGDILNLKIRDIIDEDGSIKDHMIIHEQKTGKLAKVKLNYKAKEALVEYINSKDKIDLNDYLFQNYKTGNKLTVGGARKIIKKMAKAIGLNINVGSHSLRKSFITEAINNNPNNSNVEIMASKILNHSSVHTTYAYIGKTQDEMDQFFEDNAL